MPIDQLAFSSAFGVIFTFAAILIAAGFAFAIFSFFRNVSKVVDSGHDPVTLQTDVALKALDSSLLSEKKSTEQRLRETDDLLARNVITPEEHSAARAAILAS